MSETRDAAIARIHELRENDGSTEQILEALDNLIEIDGETINLLDYRFYLLGQLQRLEEALAVAEKMEQVADRKSPWNLLRIGEGLLALDRIEEAYNWIERAVIERRFRRVSAFDQPVYGAIRSDERFQTLVDQAVSNIGIGEVAKDLSAQLLDGTTIRLRDYRQSVVLVDFWSINCPPCVDEIPSLRSLYGECHAEGFEILGISMDEDTDAVRAFAAANQMTWPTACSGKGWKDDISLLYGVQAQPSMWLIDQEGLIRFFDIRGDKLDEAVRQLLVEGQQPRALSQLPDHNNKQTSAQDQAFTRCFG